MRKFDEFLKVILAQEGGDKYHEVTGDSGLATKYGISLTFYKTIEPDATKEDIKELTYQDAYSIYKKYFYEGVNLHLIDNELLRLHLFSHGVNAGTGRAIKMLQKILGVKEDGVLGTMTASKTNLYKNPPELTQGYANARLVYYEKIVEKNPSQKKFLQGWKNRVTTTHF
jgi:lysozyme family protein